MSIGYIDILYSGQISGTTISGTNIIASSITVSNIVSTGSVNNLFTSLSAISLSASTIQSNTLAGSGTQMVIVDNGGVFSKQPIPIAGQSTAISNGLNTYTGGTSTNPTINISALTINTLTASGSSVFTGTLSGGSSFSASTLYSGSTDLYSIFALIGSGESNTASNLGAGIGIFYQKSDVDLQFKGLSAGTNITLSSSDDTITIISTGTNPIITGATKINFGFATGGEGMYATTAVTNNNITQNSIVYFRLSASTDHLDIEDSLLENISLKESNIIDGVGFTINAYSDSSTWGEYNIFYRITN